MKQARFFIYGLAGVILVAGLSWGVAAWRQSAEARARWTAATPVRPNLSPWPEPFRNRVIAAEKRLESPGDIAALGELSRLYHANGFLAEAEHGYRGLLKLDPKEPRWPHLLASLLADYGRLDEAMPLLDGTITLAPQYAPARLRLADALVKLNRPDDAATAYRNFLSVSPRNPYGLLGLARVDLETKHLNEAREKLRQAVEADAKFPASLSLLATVEGLLGNAEAADAARRQASLAGRFREAPDAWIEDLMNYCYDVYRLQVVASGLAESHNWQAARPLLERALTLAPENVATRRQLGKVFVGLSDYPHAREQFEKAVALDPHNAALYLDLVNVYRATDDLPATTRVLEAGLALSPDDAGLHYYYALALLVRGQLAEAVPHLETARRQSPDKPLAARDLIVTYFRLHRETEALAVLNDALVQNPDYPTFVIMAIHYRISKHDDKGAAKLLLHARSLGWTSEEIVNVVEEFRLTFGYLPE